MIGPAILPHAEPDHLPAAAHTEVLSGELLSANVVEPWEMPPKVVTIEFASEVPPAGGRHGAVPQAGVPEGSGAGAGHAVRAVTGRQRPAAAVGRDRIQWSQPDGRTITVEAIEIVYQPERAGDYDL